MSASAESMDRKQRQRAAEDAWSDLVRLRFQGGALPFKDMEVEMEIMDKYCALARQQRNAHLTACRLPPELLSTIFAFARSDWEPTRIEQSIPSAYEGDDPAKPLYYSGWFSVTRVCHHWRMVALQNSALWCDLDILELHPAWAHELAARTGSASINMMIQPRREFFIDKPAQRSIEAWYIPSLLQRLETLSLFNIHRDSLVQLLEWFITNPTFLQELDISVYKWDLLGDDIPHLVTVPTSLKRLSLQGCLAKHDSPIYSSQLTRLDLYVGSYTLNRDIPSVSELILLIATMHELQELSLCNIPRPDLEKNSFPAVHTFPSQFREFHLSTVDPTDLHVASEGGLCDFVRNLRFPPRAATLVDVDNWSLDGKEAIEKSTIGDLYSARAPLQLILTRNGYGVAPWSADDGPIDYTMCQGDSVTPTVDTVLPPGFRHINFHADPLHDAEAKLREKRILQSIHAFTIGSGPHAEPDLQTLEYWLSRCALVPNTRCVTMPLYQRGWITHAIEAKSADGTPEILPNLEIIAFEVLVDPYEATLEDHTTPGSLSALIENLERTLECRREMGAPIKEVRIREVMAAESSVWDRVRELTTITVWPHCAIEFMSL